MWWADLVDLERHLPQVFESHKMQWLPWIYALWQLLRTNVFVVTLLSYLPNIILIRFLSNGRQAVSLRPLQWQSIFNGGVYDFDPLKEGYWSSGKEPKTFKIVEMPQEQQEKLPRDWRCVEFEGYFYFTTQKCLDRMAFWIDAHHGEEDKAIFAKCHRDMLGTSISRQEAYPLIFSGQYAVFPDQPFTLIERADVNSKLWGTLSVVPPLLQAAGKNRTSMLVSILVIALDANRGWLYRMYDAAFLKLVLFVKPNIFGHRQWLYYLFGFFSNRWRSTRGWRWGRGWGRGWQLKSGWAVGWGSAYTVKEGEEIKVHHYSRLRSMDDVTIVGSRIYDCNKDLVIRLWDGHGMYWPMEHGASYAVVKLNKPVFIE